MRVFYWGWVFLFAFFSATSYAATPFDTEHYIDAEIDSGYTLYNNTELVYAHDENLNYVYFKTYHDEVKTLDEYSKLSLTYIHFYMDTEETLVLRLEYGQNDGMPYLVEIDKYTGKIVSEGVDPNALEPIFTEQQVERYQNQQKEAKEKEMARAADVFGEILIVVCFVILLALIVTVAVIFRKKK